MVYYVMYFIETSLGVLMCREEINKIMNVLILIIICLYKQQLNTYILCTPSTYYTFRFHELIVYL